jgi:hypothetical protein
MKIKSVVFFWIALMLSTTVYRQVLSHYKHGNLSDEKLHAKFYAQLTADKRCLEYLSMKELKTRVYREKLFKLVLSRVIFENEQQ